MSWQKSFLPMQDPSKRKRRCESARTDHIEVMEFLTNLGNTISPGIIAQLYFMRWRIEKISTR